MYWHYYRPRDFGMSAATAARAESKATTVEARCDQLEDRIDTLALVCQAMWELLNSNLPDAEAALNQKIEEIDLRDGKRDGKMSRIRRECPACHRPLHRRHLRCMYCGEWTEQENLFQK